LSLYHETSGVGCPVTLHKIDRSDPTLYDLPFGMLMLAETGTSTVKWISRSTLSPIPLYATQT
jgi:hypothetical protein